jgi:fused signal recognition particle receptor
MAEPKQPGLFRRFFSFGSRSAAEAPPPEPEAPEEPAAERESAHDPDGKPDTDAAPEIPETEDRASDDEAPPKRAENAEAEGKTPAEPEIQVGAPEAAAEPTGGDVKRGTGWMQRLRSGLARTSDTLTGNIALLFTGRKLDDDALQALEDLLIQADLGVDTAMKVTESLAAQRYGKDVDEREIRLVLAREIEKVLKPVARPLELDLSSKPHVILMVGVNGSGKTTTIGKLAAKLRAAGYSTLLVAGDTFRAAAIEQLKIWAQRTGSAVLARELGADAAALAFDAYRQAQEQGQDIVMIDTAGRLQNKSELMAELAKIIRVLRKQDPAAPHTVLLTLDATTGQNALNQVEIFGNVAGVNGLVMTKLDGTARGGILVSIAAKFGLPVYFLGVGEQVNDLEPFEAADFARSIAGISANTHDERAA